MVIAVAALFGAAWLGHRWLGERAENALLRAQVAALKRRLAQSRFG
jgi:hypothetical protein